MPRDSTDYTYVIYPLQSGFCKLPKFQIKLINFDLKQSKPSSDGGPESIVKLISTELSATSSYDSDNLDPIVQSMIPSQIFIMPHKVNIALPK